MARRVGGVRAAALSHSMSTIRRTGRLVTPSMPVSNSTLPARPPQPSWRMRLMISRSSISRRAKWVSTRKRSFPHRSHLMPQEPGRDAANGSSIASAPVGSGASPQLVQKVSIGWCPARSNPPEIARWERGEWWLAEYSKPWQPRGCYRGKRQADFWTTNSTVVTCAIRLKA